MMILLSCNNFDEASGFQNRLSLKKMKKELEGPTAREAVSAAIVRGDRLIAVPPPPPVAVPVPANLVVNNGVPQMLIYMAPADRIAYVLALASSTTHSRTRTRAQQN